MRPKWIAVTIAVTVLAFLTGVNGPLGPMLGWRPAPGGSVPGGIQIPLFIVLGLAEAAAFGFGVAFLLFGYSWMRGVGAAQAGLTRAAHLSIGWWLLNWWSHSSFHIANGPDLGGLLIIEYAYHVTLMIAATIAAAWFLTVMRRYQATATR